MTTDHLHSLHIGIDLPEGRIAAFCEKWQVVELALFGSALRGNLDQQRDVNILVTFEPGTTHGLFDVAQMESELKEIIGRDVMILTRRGVELSSNPFRRKEILDSAEVIYARR